MAEKRARGTGTIRPLEAGDRCGKWLVKWYDKVATQQRGKRTYVTKAFHGTKTEAEAFQRKQTAQIDKGRSTKPSKSTVWQCFDEWLTDRKSAGKIRPQTGADYRDTLERYVKSKPFGAMKLARVTEANVQAFIDSLSTPATKHRVHLLVQAAFKRAVRRGLMPFNPAQYIELPYHERAKRTPLTQDQVSRLLAAAFEQADAHRRKAVENESRAALLHANAKGFRARRENDKANKQEEKAVERDHAAANEQRLYRLDFMYFTFWQLLFSTGMRPSEARALQWRHLSGNVLTVEASADKKRNIGKPKNRKPREIKLHGLALDALESHRRNQQAHIESRRAAGRSYTDHGYIFANQDGGLLDWTNVRNQRWNPLVERTGIKDERESAHLDAAVPYLARHTHATVLKDAKISPVEIAARLGHDVRISLKDYQASTEQGQREALDATAVLTFTPKLPTISS